MDCPCNNSDLVMDIKQKRPYTLEEEKILREGLSDIKVTYEDVAEVEIETPFVDSKIQDIEYDKWLEAKKNKTDLKTESEKMPHAESVSVMESMDKIRALVGLTF